jgi:hypothetical protein
LVKPYFNIKAEKQGGSGEKQGGFPVSFLTADFDFQRL